MRTLLAAVLSLVSVVVFAQPSLVLVNGNVFTNDPSKPSAQAIAITGSQITAVGTNEQIKALVTDASKTRVIDVQGRMVIPGINDAHVHPSSGMTAFGLGTDSDPSWDNVAAALASAADETHADLWITGELGPTLIADKTLTREKLDKVAPGRKVLLRAFTGHGLVMSSAAMKALGVAEDAKDPAGGWFDRDASGKLTGRANEYAQWPLERRFADLATDEELHGAIQSLSGEAVRYGITSVQVMPMMTESRFATTLAKAGVPLRVRLINIPFDAATMPSKGPVKWILDGTPLERNAALREGRYPDNTAGRENFTDITPFLQAAERNKQQVLLHAVGDKTIATAVNALSARSLERPRLEHADGLQRDLFRQTRAVGAIAVLNPSHFMARPFFPANGQYQLAATLVKNDIPIAIGSDGPMNPFLNMMWAVERRDQPAEALSRQQALRAYTSGSAFAEFAETSKGKIAPGMLADIAVLSQNIFEVPAAALPATQSVLTIIDGKVVWEQP
ncbi:MAG TPA: amidohydrolase family protein [Thermoanaerobaculia bacterium]|nr:amidohydrolase family protein [Thermoanaerobaculia bacterium]